MGKASKIADERHTCLPHGVQSSERVHVDVRACMER